MTPDELATELGINGRTLRGWLRRTFPRSEGERWARWELSAEQVAAARATFAQSRAKREARAQAFSEGRTDWFWEGNVQAVLVEWLRREGWTIEFVADTAAFQRGDDIRANKAGRRLRFEVKGWPTKGYADPSRAGEVKKTNPSNQAPKWLSQAIHTVMRDLGRHPGDLVAIGLPDWPRFRNLLAETSSSLRRLEVAVFLVDEDGSVEELLPLKM